MAYANKDRQFGEHVARDEMSRLQALMSIMNRRNFCGFLAGGAATFILGIQSLRGSELLSKTAATDEAETEFEIVNGWVLRRQDTAARK